MYFNALHCFAVLSIVVAGRTGFEPATSGISLELNQLLIVSSCISFGRISAPKQPPIPTLGPTPFALPNRGNTAATPGIWAGESGWAGVDPSSEENCNLANSSRHIPRRQTPLATALA
jgi:hypothetical protein